MKKIVDQAAVAGFCIVLLSFVRVGDAETVVDQPLASVEARIGYGAALGGRAEQAVARVSPISLELRSAWLVRNAPRLSTYVSLTAELGDRNSAGVGAGATLPIGRFGRASAGATAIVTPYRLVGPTVALGTCVPLKTARPCLDLEATFYAFGNDLPSGSMVSQLQLVIALNFDVL